MQDVNFCSSTILVPAVKIYFESRVTHNNFKFEAIQRDSKYYYFLLATSSSSYEFKLYQKQYHGKWQ